MRNFVKVLLLGTALVSGAVILHTEVMAGPSPRDKAAVGWVKGADGKYHPPGTKKTTSSTTSAETRVTKNVPGVGVLTFVNGEARKGNKSYHLGANDVVTSTIHHGSQSAPGKTYKATDVTNTSSTSSSASPTTTEYRYIAVEPQGGGGVAQVYRVPANQTEISVPLVGKVQIPTGADSFTTTTNNGRTVVDVTSVIQGNAARGWNTDKIEFGPVVAPTDPSASLFKITGNTARVNVDANGGLNTQFPNNSVTTIYPTNANIQPQGVYDASSGRDRSGGARDYSTPNAAQVVTPGGALIRVAADDTSASASVSAPGGSISTSAGGDSAGYSYDLTDSTGAGALGNVRLTGDGASAEQSTHSGNASTANSLSISDGTAVGSSFAAFGNNGAGSVTEVTPEGEINRTTLDFSTAGGFNPLELPDFTGSTPNPLDLSGFYDGGSVTNRWDVVSSAPSAGSSPMTTAPVSSLVPVEIPVMQPIAAADALKAVNPNVNIGDGDKVISNASGFVVTRANGGGTEEYSLDGRRTGQQSNDGTHREVGSIDSDTGQGAQVTLDKQGPKTTFEGEARNGESVAQVSGAESGSQLGARVRAEAEAYPEPKSEPSFGDLPPEASNPYGAATPEEALRMQQAEMYGLTWDEGSNSWKAADERGAAALEFAGQQGWSGAPNLPTPEEPAPQPAPQKNVAEGALAIDGDTKSVTAAATVQKEEGGEYRADSAATVAPSEQGQPPVVEQETTLQETAPNGEPIAEVIGTGQSGPDNAVAKDAEKVVDKDGNIVVASTTVEADADGVTVTPDDTPDGFNEVERTAEDIRTNAEEHQNEVFNALGVKPLEGIHPTAPSAFSILNENNKNILGFDNVFGADYWYNSNKQPELKDGKVVFTDSTQQQRLRDVWGVTVNEDGRVVSDSTKEINRKLGDATIKALESGRMFQANLDNLAKASAAVRSAEDKLRSATKDFDRVAQKDPGNIGKAKKDLEAAQRELDEAKRGQEEAMKPVRQHIDNLHAQRDVAVQKLHDALNISVPEGTRGGAQSLISDIMNDAMTQNYDGALDKINAAEKAGQLSHDDAKDARDAVTAIKTADGNIKNAESAAANAVQPSDKLIGANLWDFIRIALEVLTPMLAEDHLALRDNINIKAGDIGPAVGAVDSTALGTDQGEDASRATTIAAGVQMVIQLLQAATVDLSLLSDEVKFDEEKEEEKPETPTYTNAGSTAVTTKKTQQESYRNEVDDSSDEDDEDAEAKKKAEEEEAKRKAEEEAKKKIDEATKKEIERRRAELMKQYVNGAIQIAEGMNAISSDFAARADVLSKASNGIQTESAGFGLAQDAGRYVLFETLRGLALSSVQMGVQASRLLFEQEVGDAE